MAENAKDILFGLIRAELLGEKVKPDVFDSLGAEGCEALYKLSKAHDLAHFAGKSWDKKSENESLEATRRRFVYEHNLALYRYCKILSVLDTVCGAFEAHGIDFVLLKGSAIRPLYPDPVMRTSCDVDILVQKGDAGKAAGALVQKGYTFIEKGSHDIALMSPEAIRVELHYALIEDGIVGRADEPLLDVFESTSPVPGRSHEKMMPDEYLYYYHIAHMAKHLVGGGCGIRPFIDILILRHRTEYDAQKRDALLSKGGLLEFARTAEKLSEIWFGEEKHDTVTEKLERYILTGGVYGNLASHSAAGQARKGGKFSYVMSRIWLSYDELRFAYPSLEGRRLLLPIYEMRRWLKLIFRGGLKRSGRELKLIAGTKDTEAEALKIMFKELGLQ